MKRLHFVRGSHLRKIFCLVPCLRIPIVRIYKTTSFTNLISSIKISSANFYLQTRICWDVSTFVILDQISVNWTFAVCAMKCFFFTRYKIFFLFVYPSSPLNQGLNTLFLAAEDFWFRKSLILFLALENGYFWNTLDLLKIFLHSNSCFSVNNLTSFFLVSIWRFLILSDVQISKNLVLFLLLESWHFENAIALFYFDIFFTFQLIFLHKQPDFLLWGLFWWFLWRISKFA